MNNKINKILNYQLQRVNLIRKLEENMRIKVLKEF